MPKAIKKFYSRRIFNLTTILVDTCAFKSNQTMEIVKQATKVIVLIGVLREMDKIVQEKKEGWKNIVKFRNEMKLDVYSEKYTIVFSRYFSYTDNDIILYCRFHRDCILLTEDTELLIKANFFRILSYITNLSRESNIAIRKWDILKRMMKKEELITDTSSMAEMEKQKVEERTVSVPTPKVLTKIESIILIGKKVMIELQQEGKKQYFLERKGEFKEGTLVVLEKGDIVYEMQYKNGVKIVQYEITELALVGAKQVKEYFVKEIQEIEKIELSSRIKIKVENLFRKYSSAKKIMNVKK